MNSLKTLMDNDCLNFNTEFDFNPINYPSESINEASCSFNIDEILITQI